MCTFIIAASNQVRVMLTCASLPQNDVTTSHFKNIVGLSQGQILF